MSENTIHPDMEAAEIAATSKRLSKGMFRMFQEFPFWAFLVEKCNIYVLPDDHPCQTACVDRYSNIRFNKKFINSCSNTMMHFVLAHEVMHLLLAHFDRVGGRDRQQWNIAGDILINSMLSNHFSTKGEHLDLSNFCTAGAFNLNEPEDTMTTEEVYDLLQTKGKNNKNKNEGDLDFNGTDDGPGSGLGGAEGGTLIKERSEAAPSGEKDWAEAGLESATRSMLAGNCPGFMKRMVTDLNTSKISWSAVLAHYLRQRFCQKGKHKSTFTPPNRRYLYQDIVFPSRVGISKPAIGFCMDTSGSMSPEDIKTGVSEVDAVRKLYKVPLYLIECDMEVHKAQWVTPFQEIPELQGGGGTDFAPVIKHITDNKVDIDVLVYFTDGYGDFGPPPNFDVLWVMTSDVVAPYGTTIKVGLT